MNSPPVEKKKRGRKKLNVVLEVTETTETTETNEHTEPTPPKPPPKKRGRKPKGGKIIPQKLPLNDSKNNEPNIILHLKCSLNDINNNDNSYPIKYNPNVESVQSFNFDNSNMNNIFIDDDKIDESIDNINDNNKEELCIKKNNINETDNIWEKINTLKVNLHKNNISDKRSACFWCTYDFDNPPIFIPKNEFKNTYQVYGCFCSPECSVAYLMNEKIDSSIKFERYQLVNHVYGKIYNYQKNIKPAPNPHYLLDKFYGVLSITEYRNLFKNDQLLIVVEKPLTHIFPELYEDNSDFILNQRIIPTNSTFKLKRKNITNKKTSVLDSLNNNKI